MQNIYENGKDYNDESKSEILPTNLGGVFAYMFAGVGLTGIVALIFRMAFFADSDFFFTSGIFSFSLIASMIGIVVLMILSHVFVRKNNAVGSLITFGLYSICMGVLLGPVIVMFELPYIGAVFLGAAASFGAMALYGAFTKKSTFGLAMFAIGLSSGMLVLSLINLFFFNEGMYYFISFLALAAMLAYTAYDVNLAKRISDEGEMSRSLAIFLALQIYTDFIYIFIRLLIILGRSKRN